MARYDQYVPYALGAAVVGAVAAAAYPKQAKGIAMIVPGVARLVSGPAAQGQARALADKWSAAFAVPVDWIMGICKVESSFRPGASNNTGGDAKRGGSWGIMQVSLATANGLALALAKNTNADVRATFAKWTGAGEDLQDIDVGMMFGTAQLGTLRSRFGDDYAMCAAAYNQGAGTVGKLVTAGNFPGGLTAHGADYVAKTESARQEWA